MHEKKIEQLLNDFHSLPDLKEVFDKVQPYILKGFNLCQQKLDLETQIELEKVLLKTFPDLLSIYGELPIEYRNTHLLKTKQTHRALLISNVEILINRINIIEHEYYERLNKEAMVKTNLLKQDYTTDKLIDITNEGHAPQIELEDSFHWGLFKRNHLKDIDAKARLDTKNIISDKKISFQSGEVKYVEKSTPKKVFKKKYAEFKKLAKGAKKLVNNHIGKIVLVSLVSGGYWFISSSIEEWKSFEIIQEAYALSGSTTQELEKTALFLLKDLESRYPKKVNIEFESEKNIATLNIKSDVKNCFKAVTNMHNIYKNHEILYRINDRLVNSSTPTNAEALCDLKENKLRVAIYTKR